VHGAWGAIDLTRQHWPPIGPEDAAKKLEQDPRAEHESQD